MSSSSWSKVWCVKIKEQDLLHVSKVVELCLKVSPHLFLIDCQMQWTSKFCKFKFGFELENQLKVRRNQSSTTLDIYRMSNFYFCTPNLQAWAQAMWGWLPFELMDFWFVPVGTKLRPMITGCGIAFIVNWAWTRKIVQEKEEPKLIHFRRIEWWLNSTVAHQTCKVEMNGHLQLEGCLSLIDFPATQGLPLGVKDFWCIHVKTRWALPKARMKSPLHYVTQYSLKQSYFHVIVSQHNRRTHMLACCVG
jgi:hypothetical protein